MSEAIQFTRELQAEETPFCQTVPKLQKAWDNTSISILKECPRKYQYTILEGWRANAKAGPLVFGGLFHNGLEVYDIARAKGAPHDEALRLAVRHALLESNRAFRLSVRSTLGARGFSGPIEFDGTADGERSAHAGCRGRLGLCHGWLLHAVARFGGNRNNFSPGRGAHVQG